MVQYLYDNNIIIYAFAALCGLGLLLRLIVNMVYKHLVKETDSPDEMKNKTLKKMKLKFETLFKLKIGVNNVDTFVDKSVLKYRFCGVLLSTWENISGQVLFLSLLLVPIFAVFGVTFDCGQDQIMLTGAVGISTSALLILVDKGINLGAKKRILRLNLLDYLENFCKVRLEKEVFHPELLEQYRREYFQVEDGSKKVSAEEETTVKEEAKDELNRRREARRKKEEERKLQAAKREEEQRKLEVVRKEEEKRRLEERRQMAAKRREEERLKLEEEREALETRRAELKRKAAEKQLASERRQENKEKTPVAEKVNKEYLSAEEEKPQEMVSGLNELNNGLDEVAASEQALLERMNQEQSDLHKVIVINHIEKKIPEQESGADDSKDTEDRRVSQKAAAAKPALNAQEIKKQPDEKPEDEKLTIVKGDTIKVEKEKTEKEKTEKEKAEKEKAEKEKAEKEKAEKEKAEKEKADREKVDREKVDKEKQLKSTTFKVKIPGISPQEEKIIEDVLKDFFA